MKLPDYMPARPDRGEAARMHLADDGADRGAADRMNGLGGAPQAGISPDGCCAQVCAPLVGCHCVAESPFCP